MQGFRIWQVELCDHHFCHITGNTHTFTGGLPWIRRQFGLLSFYYIYFISHQVQQMRDIENEKTHAKCSVNTRACTYNRCDKSQTNTRRTTVRIIIIRDSMHSTTTTTLGTVKNLFGDATKCSACTGDGFKIIGDIALCINSPSALYSCTLTVMIASSTSLSVLLHCVTCVVVNCCSYVRSLYLYSASSVSHLVSRFQCLVTVITVLSCYADCKQWLFPTMWRMQHIIKCFLCWFGFVTLSPFHCV